jgi:hypothetical protein
MRHDGEDHDSFEPRSIGEIANVRGERHAGGLRRRRWKPYDAPALGT